MIKNKTLNDLKPKEIAKVVSINAGKRAVQRLSGMGIVPDTKIQVVSSAPFKGPIQISVRGTRLAVGFGLASKVNVQLNSDPEL